MRILERESMLKIVFESNKFSNKKYSYVGGKLQEIKYLGLGIQFKSEEVVEM